MLKFFRFYAWLYRLGVPVLPKLCYLINRVVFAVVLPPSVKVGQGVEFAYQGLGVIVHARAVIGDKVYVGPQVIIGGRSGEHEVPVIEEGAILGAGSRILGPVRIGKGATVAAAALVIKDVVSGETVAGVPAKPIRATRRERPM
jgi:serine O-acetyltransferase